MRHVRSLYKRLLRKDLPYNLRDQEGLAWEARSHEAARLLREVAGEHLPGSIRIADIGCGNQRLRGALETEFGASRIAYQGFDIHPQRSDVIMLDLTKSPPPGQWDVVATLGVLEYIDDRGAMLTRLASVASWYVLSHVVSGSGRVREADSGRYGWTRLPSVAEQSDELRGAGFSVAGERLVDDGRTCLWICRSDRQG